MEQSKPERQNYKSWHVDRGDGVYVKTPDPKCTSAPASPVPEGREAEVEPCPACHGSGKFEWFGHADSTDGYESENPDDLVPRNRERPCAHCLGTGRSTYQRLLAAGSRVSLLEDALRLGLGIFGDNDEELDSYIEMCPTSEDAKFITAARALLATPSASKEEK